MEISWPESNDNPASIRGGWLAHRFVMGMEAPAHRMS